MMVLVASCVGDLFCEGSLCCPTCCEIHTCGESKPSFCFSLSFSLRAPNVVVLQHTHLGVFGKLVSGKLVALEFPVPVCDGIASTAVLPKPVKPAALLHATTIRQYLRTSWIGRSLLHASRQGLAVTLTALSLDPRIVAGPFTSHRHHVNRPVGVWQILRRHFRRCLRRRSRALTSTCHRPSTGTEV